MALPLLALAGIPSLIKGIAGIGDIFGGKRRARQNQRPVAQVNENYLKNVALAENMGRVGLPQQQYNRGIQNIARNQSTAFNTLSRSANPSAGIQGLLRASNDATLGLDVQDANARLNNQRFAFGQRGNLAQEQQRVWNWNKRDKYLEDAQAAAQQIGSGKQNAFGALTDASSLGQTYLAGEAFGQQGGTDMVGNQQGSQGFISNYNPNAIVSAPRQRFEPRQIPINYGRFTPKFKF